MEKINPPWPGVLKVVGIVQIFRCAGFFLVSLLFSVIERLLADSADTTEESLIDGVWEYVSVCYALFMSIMAVVYCKRLEKAGLLLILAYIGIGCAIADGVVSVMMFDTFVEAFAPLFVSGGYIPIVFFAKSMAICMIFVPLQVEAIYLALYIIAASKNKKAFEGLKPAQVQAA